LWDLSPWSATSEYLDVPVSIKKWTVSVDSQSEDNNEGTHRGIRGMHIGFPSTQKGLLLYVPSTRQIASSGDVICDEILASTEAETWRPIHDALTLRHRA
jgi:hypothetical protein